MSADRVAYLRRLAANIVTAHISHNPVAAESLLDVIQSVYATLSNLGRVLPAAPSLHPAVPIKKSVFPSYLVCLEDGLKMKMLKRHLQTWYGMTPDAYRAKWGLPDTYPMTASDYAARRSTLAKSFGLGRKSDAATSVEMPVPEPLMPFDVPIRRFPAKTRGRKPDSKTADSVDAAAAAGK